MRNEYMLAMNIINSASFLESERPPSTSGKGEMAFLPTAFLLTLLVAVHGEYLQPPDIPIGSNFLTTVTANSTCEGVSYIELTPSGPTNNTGTCDSIPGAAVDGVLTTQWFSAPGDNVVEFSVGLSGLELSQIAMNLTSPLPMVMTVETVPQSSSSERRLLHVLAVDPAVCSSLTGSVCRTFSNVTLSSSEAATTLQWPVSLGRSDDMSEDFFSLITASSIIFTLSGFHPSLTDPGEQYFAVSEITLRGRCACNGHASSATVVEDSCNCICQHGTAGQYCEECAAGSQFSLWRRALPDCPFVCQSDACDVGGAIREVTCTNTSCTCRNNIVGETCDRPNSGFFVPSVQAISVEAETGIIVETGQDVLVDSDPANIPVFQGLGYASYSLAASTSQTIQWSISIPVTSSYYMALVYHLPIREGENAFTATFLLSRNTLMMSSRLPVNLCPSPPCSTISQTAVNLEQGTWRVQLRFAARSVPTPEFYIDTVFAFPVEFHEATLLGNDSQMFIDTCNAQNSELIGSFCRESSFSLSAFFHDGARACSCDPNGANGTTCEPLGGQCPCYSPASFEDVSSTDRQCSVCPLFYYGPSSSGCMPCGCATDDNMCNSVSGQCNCPLNVEGRTCDQCTSLSFGYNATSGCQTCSCHPLGTAACDNVTGDCQCHPLVSGSLCATCDSGAYNLTARGCVPCACDLNGSVGPNCSSDGLCTCKAQVNGDKCSLCTNDSFYFPPYPSSAGCLSCYCSGVTTSCTAYIGEYTAVELVGPPSLDLSGWRLATLDGEGVQQLTTPPSIVQTNSSSMIMVSTFNVDPSIVGVVYWSFPRMQVLGNDWLLSYDGSIHFTYSVVGSLGLPEIILVAGTTMAAVQLFPVHSNTTYNISVPLAEGRWQSKLDGSFLSREALLQVLARLDFILITALDLGTTSSALTAASYDSATSAGSRALPIERCSCPPEYTGLSCESCSPGYYHRNGTCVPCSCNSRSAYCDEFTGVCLNCIANTSGPNCERCADGYFNSNPSGEPLQCQLCPCDNTTTTSSSCTALADGSPQCTCNRGYIGSLCNQCDDGYHGNPPAVPCMSCDCNGNIDPSVPGSCNTSSGECLICTNNATGQQCERCVEGFYGDATAQQCQECSCDPIGSMSLVCHHASGQCPCKDGVDGQMCDVCQPGTWNLASGTGCEPCGCDSVGSYNTSCNSDTGQCSCKPGITGRTCDTCDIGFYGFSNEGCSECGCGAGAQNQSCLQLSGQCFCLPGVMGRTCNMCQAYFENLTASGCQDCGECVNRLVSIVSGIEGHLQGVVSSVYTLVALQQLDVDGLSNISTRLNEILTDITAAEASLNAVYTQFGMLMSSRDGLSARLGYLESTLAGLQPRIQMLLDMSDIQLTSIAGQDTAMTGALIAAAELSDYLQHAQMDLLAWQLEVNEIHVNITAIHSSITAVDFGANITSAEEDAGFIETVLSTAQSAESMSLVQQGQADNLYRMLASLQGQNSLASEQLQVLVTNLAELESTAEAVANMSADTTSVTAFVNSSISVSVANSTTVSMLVENASNVLKQIQLYLEQLATALDLSVITYEMVLDADSTPQPLPQAIEDIQESLARLLEVLLGVHRLVVAAEQHRADISSAAEEVQRILGPSLSLGADALRVVTDYEQVVENIDLALNISTAANGTAAMAYQQASQLIAQGHVQQAVQLLNISQALLGELQALEPLASAALQQTSLAGATSLRVTGLVQELQAIGSYITNLTTRLEATAASATVDIDTALQSVSDDTMCVASAYSNVSSTSQMTLSNVARTMATVARVESVMLNTTATTSSARSLLSDANAALVERSTLLDQIASEQKNVSDLYQVALSELSDLRSRLETIKQAAARISVAVRLDGNSSLGYNTPPEVAQSDFLCVSLFFRPEVFSGTLFSTPTLTGQPLSLFIVSGGVALSYPTSMSDKVVTRLPFPVENDWYHLLATEDSSSGSGSSVRLSVAEFGGGRQWSTTEVIPGKGLNYSSSTEVTIGGGPPFEGMNNYFTGCIDGVELNSVPLPLLTPATPPATCGQPCGPRPPVEADRQFENGTWFLGRGFVEVSSSPSSNRLTLTLWFRSLLSEGLLFQAMGAASTNQFIAMYITDGRLHLASSLAGADAFTVATAGQYNDGSWHYVVATVVNQTGNVDLDYGTEVVTGNSTFAITMQRWNLSSTVHFGGVPTELAGISPADVTTGFAGCMRGITLNGQDLSLSESNRFEQVQFGGCPAEVVSGVRFMGDGMAEFQPYMAPIISVAFYFKTEQLAGVLFEAYPLQVSIYHTHVRVSFNRVVVETAMPGYSDNQWHSVVVGANFTYLQLRVDGESWLRKESLDITLTENSDILVGGTGRIDNKIASSFRGCIQSVVINDVESLDFNSALRLEGAALYGCRPAVPVVLPSTTSVVLPSATSFTSIMITSFVTSSEVEPSSSSSQETTQPSETPSPSAVASVSQLSLSPSSTSLLDSFSSSVPTSLPFQTPTPSTTLVVISESSVFISPSPSITALPLPPPPPPLPPPSQSAVTSSPTVSFSSAVISQIPSPSATDIISTSSFVASPPPSTSAGISTSSFVIPDPSSAILPTSSFVEESSSISVEVTPTFTTSSDTTDVSSATVQPTVTAPSTSSVADSILATSEETLSFITSTSGLATTPLASTSAAITPTPSLTPSSDPSSAILPTSSFVEESSSISVEVTPTFTTSSDTTDVSMATVQPTVTAPSTSSVADSILATSEETLSFITSTSALATTPLASTSAAITPTPSLTPSPEPVVALSGVYGSFLSFAVFEEDLKLGFNITIEFRALSSEGVVLFVGNNSVGDFLALELKAGYLVYSFNLGAETAVLRSRETYDDGQFHMVSLHRQREVGSITVDRTDVVSGRPAGPYVGLDIAQEVLFLGGLPTGVTPRGILQPGETSRPSVIACFSQLSVNLKPFDLSVPLGSQGVTDCPAMVTNEATFSGNGFVQLLDAFSPGIAFTVSLWFRTAVCDGILFYLANLEPSATDYTSLELIAGVLRFTFDNGAGAVALEYLPTNGTYLCREEWVSVAIVKNGISGEMLVNGESVAMESSELVNLLAVDATHPLYLGGVPYEVQSSQMVETANFVGCMRDVVVSSNNVITKPNFAQSSLLVNATAGECQTEVAGVVPQ